MKHRLIAAVCAVVMTAANVSAVMPQNPSVAARQLPLEGEQKIVADYAAPEGKHWSSAEKVVNSKPYQPPERDGENPTTASGSPPLERGGNAEGVEFVATAYCPCAKCCGAYAYNRPTDENGEPIVYTATGTRAVQGRTIAVDPRVIPYGTHVLINGAEYVAEDCGSGVRGHHIDIYFADHDAAKAFGVQTVTVEVLE